MNNVRVKIEIDPDVKECEVTIKCSEIDAAVARLQKAISEAGAGSGQISFFKEDTEYFLPASKILFFETDGGVIRAHTTDDEFEVKYKLYELEELLPAYFMRISKSTILNIHKVYSLLQGTEGKHHSQQRSINYEKKSKKHFNGAFASGTGCCPDTLEA